MTENKWLLRVVRIIGRKAIMRILGISTQRLNSWINQGIEIPYEYALILEFLVQGQIKAEQLSPKKVLPLKQLGIKVHISKIK